MSPSVKKNNRLPASYDMRCREVRLTRRAIAAASADYHPKGKRVYHQFIHEVLSRQAPCPPWLRKALNEMLAEAERREG